MIKHGSNDGHGGLKRECLNFFVCFVRRQLDTIVRCWITHYNTKRSHRGFGMDNRVLDEQFRPQREGPVRCREELGGLIKEYHDQAARIGMNVSVRLSSSPNLSAGLPTSPRRDSFLHPLAAQVSDGPTQQAEA